MSLAEQEPERRGAVADTRKLPKVERRGGAALGKRVAEHQPPQIRTQQLKMVHGKHLTRHHGQLNPQRKKSAR